MQTDYYQQRCQNISDEKLQGIDVYPSKFAATIQIQKFIDLYGNSKSNGPNLTTGLTLKDIVDKQGHPISIPCNTFITDVKESLMGRVSLLRTAGKKLIFMTVIGDSYQTQFLINMMYYEDKEDFNNIVLNVKRGDIIGAFGHPGRSKTGELSLYVTKLVRLVPCLHEIPSSFFGIADNELRARQRYLDLIVNAESRTPFIIRSKIISNIRRYLDDLNFTEVQTPILSTEVGGAVAKPFITFHNDKKIDMFMRIAPELYLKQLVVGGFERIYEIGQQFRNESITYKHNPEFTSLEFYMVGADYLDLMIMCEDMIKHIVTNVCGTCKIKYRAHGGSEEIDIDFGQKFAVVDIISTLEKETDTKFPDDLFSENTNNFLIELCKKYGIDCELKTTAKMIDKLTGHFIEPKCINPTFLINHPRVMSPLAKPHRSNHNLTERFELFICGMEFANAYTELNDPVLQQQAFVAQMEDKKKGDTEAPEIDHGFIRSLEYGLAPTGGFGMGIDRMAMLLSNRSSIRDVILFPTLVPVSLN